MVDTIMVSRDFMLAYAGEISAAYAEDALKGAPYDWRKKKRLVNAARREGRRSFIASGIVKPLEGTVQ